MERGPYRLPGAVLPDRPLLPERLPSVILDASAEPLSRSAARDALPPVVAIAHEEEPDETSLSAGIEEGSVLALPLAVVGVGLLILFALILPSATLVQGGLLVLVVLAVLAGVHSWKRR
jgi:hypothetical protein